MRYIKQLKKWLPCILAVIVLIQHPLAVKGAEAPYTTLTIDKDGYFISTQDGYIPSQVYDKFGEETLKNPSDLFIWNDSRMYIADTGNSRVLICDMAGALLNTIRGDLKSPTGLYVDSNETVYVADPKLQKIMVYDKTGNFVKAYEKPISPLFAEESRYAPTKLVVNAAGGIYALSEGNGNGILSFSAEGDFYGYFGANYTYTSFSQILKRFAFTEEMKKSLQKNVPAAACNIEIDNSGLIYTVTQGTSWDALKKFNMAGKNMLEGYFYEPLVTDVTVGNIENIYTVSKDGYIGEYTRDKALLFYFGGKDDGNNRTGLFTAPSAIDTDSQGRLYVLDSEQANITVFAQTEYAKTVHEALYLFQEGYYTESQEPWEKVLSKNSLFDYARSGIGKAYYRLEDYSGALAAARQGGDYTGYSDAFWELRNRWIRENVVTVLAVLLALYLLRKIYKKTKNKVPFLRKFSEKLGQLKERKILRQLSYLKYIPKNPADAFYGIKFEGKVSIVSATLIYIFFFLTYVINKYYSGFLFKTVTDGYYEIGTDFMMVFGFFLISLICCNMICSIQDGEGSIKNMYCAYAYCLMPYIFLKPAVILLGHVLTFNEGFIIHFLNFFIIAGMAILITVMIKEIQAYTYKQTFKCILLTVFTMILVMAAGFILIALISQVMDFVVSIIKEGYYRGR